MDVSPALKHFGISHTSTIHAVQQVREWIEQDNDGPFSAVKLIDQLVGVSVDLTKFNGQPVGNSNAWAIALSQAVVEKCIKQNCIVDNPQEVIDAAWERTQKFILNPLNSWMFALPEETTSGGEVKAVSTQVDVKVEVKADGKIKKGGKETLAIALYQKYVAELNGAEYSNQAFIAILMRELGMTKPGATTYNYNMKKKFGGAIASKK